MKSYKLINVAADNQCLYNAVACGIIHHKLGKSKLKKISYKKIATTLKNKVVNFYKREIENNNNKIIEQLSLEWIILSNKEINKDEEKLEFANKYIEHIQKSTSWGGQPELVGMSKYLHKLGFKGVKVYDDNFNIIKNYKSKFKTTNKLPYIKIILHGTRLGGVHFNYIYN